MQELSVHNHLIGNGAALDEVWDRAGYWFFRGVLDTDCVARLRGEYVRELERLGFIDPQREAPTEKSVLYNGKSLKGFPHRMELLAATAPWRAFAEAPPIRVFFTRLFGAEPFWVPIAEYRATPPVADRQRSRFDAIHQDGPYSPGIPFKICWIPLAEIDSDTGGVALVEGLTDRVNRHPVINGSNTTIPPESLPAAAWRRTTYQAGDLLLMNLWTPHSGLSNLSNRFRLSLDIRIMSSAEKCPLIGVITRISHCTLTLSVGGEDMSLAIDENTYARDTIGQKLSLDAISSFFAPGSRVIVAEQSGVATVIRSPH